MHVSGKINATLLYRYPLGRLPSKTQSDLKRAQHCRDVENRLKAAQRGEGNVTYPSYSSGLRQLRVQVVVGVFALYILNSDPVFSVEGKLQPADLVVVGYV